jgi:4-alpha-glucanotransferase
MAAVRFVRGIHAHQPVGNFPGVLADAYRCSYVHFLDVLSGFPQIPFAFPASGVLFDWLEPARPERLDRLPAPADRRGLRLMLDVETREARPV